MFRTTGKWILIFFLFAVPAFAGDGRWRRVSAALHLHSDISPRGAASLDSMGALAARKKIDVLIPTDHFLSLWEYGLQPLPGLLRISLHERDVVRYGVGHYFDTLRALEAHRPGLLVLPGVETRAAYYWTGHPAKGDLTLHDAQRHMLVFGISDPEVLRRLPVQSNAAAGSVPWKSLVLPGLLVALGLSLAIRWPAGFLVAVLGGLWAIDQRPFHRLPAAESYERNGYAAAQSVIDYVTQHSGLVVWAHPEAPNWKTPQKVGRVTSLESPPYPEALLETEGATGFAYFWEGTKVAGVPGGTWDQELRLYMDGKRRAPLWAFGELDWSREGASGVVMDRIQNVLWVHETSVEEVLDAFRRGRFYVLDKSEEPAMVLARWEASNGKKASMSGESLNWSPETHLSIRLEGAAPVRVEVIRNGAVWKTVEGLMPFSSDLPAPRPEGSGDFYRFVARSRGTIVSNPIFVRK